MSKLERAYITTAENTFKKVIDKNGVERHFKNGTPIKQEAFNAGQNSIKYEGQFVNVAIPSDKGPGYIRKKVSPIEASALGQELRFMRDDVPGEPRDTVTIDGEKYDINVLAELNERITDRHGPDTVFRYS